MPEISPMEEKIMAWRVSDLFRYGLILMAANILNTLLLILVFGPSLDFWIFWPWVFAQTCFIAQRAWSLWSFFQDEKRGFKTKPRRWGWSLFRAALYSGLIWSLWVLTWGPRLPFNLLIIECVLLACVTMGALSHFLPAYYAFCLPLSASFAYLSFQRSEAPVIPFGFHGVLLSALLFLLAYFLNRHLTAIYRLRYANLELLEKLGSAKTKAEQALASKNRFLAAASHDLRQPLQAQGLFLHALKNEGNARIQRAIRSKLEATHQALGHMLDGLLDLSLTESGTLSANTRPFPLKPLFAKLASEFSTLARRKGLGFSARTPDTWAQSDPELLERMLRNLLSNAVRYTKKGRIELRCRPQKNYLWLEVADTGPGIAPGEQEKIFEEFYQIKSEEKNPQGLGLGLSIVRGLSRVLSHPVALLSLPRLKKGCVFSVRVPCAKALKNNKKKSNSFRMGKFNGQAVLILDDDPAIREGLEKLLRSWNLIPLAAASVNEALAILAKKEYIPRVLLCDFHLGEKETGEEAIAQIRVFLKNKLPAILITGNAAPERVRSAGILGLPLLFKPVDPLKLHQTLKKLMADPA